MTSFLFKTATTRVLKQREKTHQYERITANNHADKSWYSYIILHCNVQFRIKSCSAWSVNCTILYTGRVQTVAIYQNTKKNFTLKEITKHNILLSEQSFIASILSVEVRAKIDF